ncbi:helix-turn-helix transcriptional regulator [Flavobacteriaceae bacterium]|nr:helix-turn-helix transcriptional regulator [Flavobacteriaceae bacterium]
MKPIAVELKAIRTSKKISQESLAYACGLSRNYVGVIEKGENKISLEVFLKLCAGLQIHPNQILDKFSKEDLETLLFEQ